MLNAQSCLVDHIANPNSLLTSSAKSWLLFSPLHLKVAQLRKLHWMPMGFLIEVSPFLIKGERYGWHFIFFSLLSAFNSDTMHGAAAVTLWPQEKTQGKLDESKTATTYFQIYYRGKKPTLFALATVKWPFFYFWAEHFPNGFFFLTCKTTCLEFWSQGLKSGPQKIK